MNNLLHGIGKMKTEDGSTYIGEFHTGKINKGVCNYINGSTYKGTFGY